tara:strand:- start:2773 stop:3813 length:1041 start_codon:yes stop_codon:yes gene_type:complete
MSYISFQPHDHFKTLLYVGNGSDAHAITGVGFKPDFVWTKNRSSATNNYLHDIVRGVQNAIRTDVTSATYATSINLQSFDSDGFTLGTQDGLNKNGDNIVSWNWLAGGSQGSSNTDGSINTTYTSVNTTAGISISSYTGTGATATVGHGLGVAPKVVIIKGTSNTGTWGTYHTSLGATKKIILNSTAAEASSGWMNNTAPTSSVFTVINDADVGSSGYTYVAYCFAEKTGYSKFGSFVGNGSTNGTFIYTGFKPAFVMLKYSSPTSGVGNWGMHDSARDVDNPVQKGLLANSSAVEDTHDFMDFFSNGFKLRSTSSNRNESGSTYIFMAFAEEPIVSSNGVPATAR